MPYRTCDHLKEDSVYCDSPALRGQNFCYYHLNVRARRLQMARARRRGEACRIQLPVLDDMHSVQVALQQVLDALADDRIDPKRAGLMLYALQQAAANLNGTRRWKGSRPTAEYDEPLRALEVPDFEQQYDLPQGVDLNLPPDVALENAEQDPPVIAPKKRRRPARVSLYRRAQEEEDYEEEEEEQPEPELCVPADDPMAWFFNRLGIKPVVLERREQRGCVCAAARDREEALAVRCA